MSDWSGRRVVILGAARQGTALARYLALRGAQVVLNDRRPASQLQQERESLADLEGATDYELQWVCGAHPLDLLDGADLLCVSGGVPLIVPVVMEAQARGISLSNDSQIFLEAAPCKVIGITGSAGKTTTVSLVGRMAQAAVESQELADKPRRVWVGGNIGTPLLAMLDQMSADDLAVMELSSFQLEIMTLSPQVAAVLNITPNHLDRHGTMAAYTSAKARILEFQSPADVAILGSEDPGAWSLADRVRGKLVTFGLAQPHTEMVGRAENYLPGTYLDGDELFYNSAGRRLRLMSRSEIGLRGEHNLLNVLAACAIGLAAGFTVESLRAGVQGFTGVPHRLEFVRSWGGADWYNDSIATAPERTIAAIRSFDGPLVLLLGGRDKDLPWNDLALLVRQRVDHVIVFGEAAEKIIQAVNSVRVPAGSKFREQTMTRCGGLRQAVEAASHIVHPGDVVLLSPGGTSYDEFIDFEERGECFRQLVTQL